MPQADANYITISELFEDPYLRTVFAEAELSEAPVWLPGRDEILSSPKGFTTDFFRWIRASAKACELPLSKLSFPSREIAQYTLAQIDDVIEALGEITAVVEAGKARLTAAAAHTE